MKKIKKLLLTLCVILSFSSVTAFADEASDYYSAAQQTYSDEETALSYVQSYLQTFGAMNLDEVEYYKENTSGFIQTAAETFYDYISNDTLGEFSGVTDTKTKELENGYSATAVGEFEKMNVTMTVECKYIGGTITPVSITISTEDNSNKSLGDKLGDAALNTVLGLFTVCCILILISFIISLFKYIPALEKKFTEKKNETKDDVMVTSSIDKVVSQIEEANKNELVDDSELVAVITAAICAATKGSSDGFVVRSIKKSKRKFD